MLAHINYNWSLLIISCQNLSWCSSSPLQNKRTFQLPSEIYSNASSIMAHLYLLAVIVVLLAHFSPSANAQNAQIGRTKQNNANALNRQLRGTADAIANAEFRQKQFLSLVGTTQQRRPSSSPASVSLNLPTSSFNPEMSYFHPRNYGGLKAMQAPKLSSSVINTSGGLSGTVSASASASSQVN